MALHRVVQHLKSQNWTAVALARADNELAAVLRSAREASIAHYSVARDARDTLTAILERLDPATLSASSHR